jgi:uncharacterized protein DUF6898
MPKRELSNSDDVYFELIAIGHSVKVTAIHAASGTEVSVIGPASAARSDLERLAIQKLAARLKNDS